jgi:hypothetical protein
VITLSGFHCTSEPRPTASLSLAQLILILILLEHPPNDDNPLTAPTLLGLLTLVPNFQKDISQKFIVSGVCTSCRSFFRRSVQSGQFKTFDCKNKNNSTNTKLKSANTEVKSTHTKVKSEMCSIDSKTRRSCKKCRFDRLKNVKFLFDCGGKVL